MKKDKRRELREVAESRGLTLTAGTADAEMHDMSSSRKSEVKSSSKSDPKRRADDGRAQTFELAVSGS